MTSENSKFVLIHPNDNVLICRQRARAGERVHLGGQDYSLNADIEVGHKIAKHNLKGGDKVLRYGVSIGTMAEDAQAGSHIHTHNLKSDYISSHHRDAETLGSDT